MHTTFYVTISQGTCMFRDQLLQILTFHTLKWLCVKTANFNMWYMHAVHVYAWHAFKLWLACIFVTTTILYKLHMYVCTYVVVTFQITYIDTYVYTAAISLHIYMYVPFQLYFLCHQLFRSNSWLGQTFLSLLLQYCHCLPWFSAYTAVSTCT